jgi:outer membrane protein assembly factor BamB
VDLHERVGVAGVRRAALALAVVVAGCGGAQHTTSSPPAPHVGPRARTAAPGWPTYHGDLARSGSVTSGPSPASARLVWSAPVDAPVYAEPVVAGGRVVVATENDSLYAFDTSGRMRWHAKLGSPVPGGDLPCGNIDPSGITGTPAVDAGVVYAVTFERPAHHTLVAVDLATGAVRWRRAVDPPGADPSVEQQRGAIAVANGRVYVAYGGLFGDCGAYNGWVVGVSTAHPASTLSAYRVPSARKGGIWAASGPAVDASGSLYVSTGNGVSSSFDFGNAVIRLSPTLARQDFFAPPNAAQLNGPDADLGSVGPLLLPGGRVAVVGKDGVGYLASTTHMGGVGGQLTSRSLCGGNGAFGGLAYANGDIYVPCTSGLVAVRADDLGAVWSGPSFTAGAPIAAAGAVWVVDTDAGKLYALDASTGSVRFSASIGTAAHFATPAAAGGRVYVAGGGHLLAFG